MKIVVLDGYTLNPGDLSWDALEALGDCTMHDRTAPEEVIERAAGAQIILTNKTVVGEEHFAQLPALKYIGVLATGYNVVDTEAAARRGIAVTNVPAYSTRSVAQMAFAHILHFCHHVGEHGMGVREGKWAESADFCYWEYPLVELADMTLGIVGLGRIGKAVAQLGVAFGMRVLAHDRSVPEALPEGVMLVDLEPLFEESDVVTLHCPLTEENKEFVNTELLNRMKSSAFLVNTSRGPLIDEAALADALNAGRIAGAGLDVLSVEPPAAANPLLSARNCFITPHISWATAAARRRLMGTAVGNIQAFLDGRPVNVINGVGA